MANTPANISDDLYARLRHLFSEEQLLELGAHIAFENYLFEISCGILSELAKARARESTPRWRVSLKASLRLRANVFSGTAGVSPAASA
jgi:hypothetical protein